MRVQECTMTSWDYTPSHQQARLYHISQREADESMHMQELAGVGKTYLIRLMLEILPASSTLLLAFTGAQLAALRSRLGGLQVTEMTFRTMADKLLTQDRGCAEFCVTGDGVTTVAACLRS